MSEESDNHQPPSDKPKETAETTGQESVRPRSEPALDEAFMRPPVAEIDEFLRQGYRQPDIERVLRRRYGRGFRAEIRARARLARSASPASGPAAGDAPSPAANEAAKSPADKASFEGQEAMPAGKPASLEANVDAEDDEALKQRESEAKKKMERLKRKKRLREVEAEVQREEHKLQAETMLDSEALYLNGMQGCLQENPWIKMELLRLLALLGRNWDFDSELERLLREQFEYLTITFPAIVMKSNGYRIGKFPIDAKDEWRLILRKLQIEVASQWYAVHMKKLAQIIPTCPIDNLLLGTSDGRTLVCPRGHAPIPLCPDCGSDLILVRELLHCPECFRRLNQ